MHNMYKKLLTILLGEGLGIIEDGFIRGINEGDGCGLEIGGSGPLSLEYMSL